MWFIRANLYYEAYFAGLSLHNLLSVYDVGRHVSREVGTDLVMVKRPERELLSQILEKTPDDGINPYPRCRRT
jgi:hypothetical protein